MQFEYSLESHKLWSAQSEALYVRNSAWIFPLLYIPTPRS